MKLWSEIAFDDTRFDEVCCLVNFSSESLIKEKLPKEFFHWNESCKYRLFWIFLNFLFLRCDVEPINSPLSLSFFEGGGRM